MRRLARIALATLGVLALLFTLWFCRELQSQFRHLDWYRAVEFRILCLAERKPDDVAPKQWASCLRLTWNLHSNFGGLTYWQHGKEKFLSDLDARLQGKVDLATIDWFWDQYTLHPSRHWSDNYRPTTAARMEEASKDAYNENDLNRWIERLNERRQAIRTSRR